MEMPAASFDGAWARFQALDSLQLVGDSSGGEWTRGRAQALGFQVRLEGAAARNHIAQVVGRLAGIAGVEPFPDWFWHVTVKGVGFQVIKRTHEDDVLRQDVSRIAEEAREVLSAEKAFQAQLGPASGFASVVFLEVWDEGRMRQLNERLMEDMPNLFRYPIDGAGFLPHISIARFTSSEGLSELKEALARVRAEGPGPSFTVRRVEFVKAWLTEEVTPFDVLATFALKPPR